MEAASHPWPTLGVLLLRDGIVTKEDLEAVLDTQRDSRRQRLSGSRLGELLVEHGLVTRDQVAKLLAEQYELPFIDLNEDDVDLSVARRLKEDLARGFRALPLSALPGGSLLVAIADPATVVFAEDLRNALGAALRFAVVPPDAMDSALERVYDSWPGPALEEETSEPSETDEPSEEPAVASSDDETEHDEAESPTDGRYLGSARAVAQLWPPL